MSANLDRLANGMAAFVSRIQTAWHREGTVFDRAPSYEEAMEHGGLDWEVEKVPHYVHLERVGRMDYLPYDTIQKVEVESKDSFSVVRTDRDEVIGTVGHVWKPLQNRTAFGMLEPLLDQGYAQIETAGSLNGGQQVWMLVQFNLENIVRHAEEALSKLEIGEDAGMAALYDLIEETAPFALFSNDHGGKAKARIMETWVRVVCSNTFRMALGKAEQGINVEVSHTSNVVQDYTDGAKVLLGGIASRYVSLAETRAMMERTVLPSDISYATSPFRSLVLDTAVPILHLEKKVQRREDSGQTRAALDRAHDKRAEITRLWTRGDGHSGSHSAWEAFQGLVQWTDHDDAATRGDTRVASLYSGSLAEVKNRVGRQLLAYAQQDASNAGQILIGPGSGDWASG